MTNKFMNDIVTATATEDQTEVSKGFVREVAPAGFTPARFVGYVEVGKQPQRAFEGVEKPDAAEVRLTFELNGPKHITEYEVEGEKKTRTNLIHITSTISNNEKSNFYKLLQKMLYGRTDITHMAQMLGEGFLVKVTHNASKKDPKKVYANLKSDVWDIGQASVTDPITNLTTNIPVPAASANIQCLIWNNPSADMWASIFIDGTYEREENGVKVVKSKNFIQDLAMSASNFVGSPLEGLVMGGVDILDALTPEAPEAPKAVDTPPAPVEAPEVADPLAALGLA